MITYTDSVNVTDWGVPWPGYEKKDYSKLTDQELLEDCEFKTKIDKAAQAEPVKMGWTLDSWREVCANFALYVIHCILGGNRASKSVFVARLFVHLLEVIPEARLRAYHVNSAKSIAEQQAFIWDALPQRYKDLSGKRSPVFSTTYTQRNGFVGDKLILPPKPGHSRGSELIFGTYQQYKNDPQVVEGWWAHAIWCDEEAPQKMFERLLTRLYDMRGRMFLTFTTIQGWSPLVADIMGKVKTLRRRYSELLKREIPVAQESLTRTKCRIYNLWTQDNPFIPPETIERMRGRPEAEILAVAHGIPTRSSTSKFPKFKEEVHVIKDELLPWKRTDEFKQEESDFTRYQVLDPSGSKPWFLIWAAISRSGDIYVYRDWPDIGFGSWGEPSEKPEGSAGPAQKPNGFGIFDYVDTFKDLEQGEDIFERIIDPRMGAATTQALSGATSIISSLLDAGLVFIAAPGTQIDNGIQLISEKLGYNEEKPIDAVNHPKLYVSSHCEQVIEALKNYTGCARTEVWKDPVDCLRYLLETGADFVDKAKSVDTGRTFTW